MSSQGDEKDPVELEFQLRLYAKEEKDREAKKDAAKKAGTFKESERPPIDRAVKSLITQVIARMREFPEEPSVQIDGCRQLHEAAVDDVQARLALQFCSGALKQLVMDLVEHKQDEVVVLEACRALRSACFLHLPSVQMVLDEGKMKNNASEALVALMTEHPLNAVVQEASFGLICALACESEEGRIQLAAAGAIRATVIGTATHRLMPAVQLGGIKAINNMCINNPPNVREAIQGDAAKAVVGAMERLVKDPQAQRWGCVAMCGLTHEYAEGRMAVGSEGGLRRAIEALKGHQECEEVQLWGSAAITNLLICNTHNLDEAVSLGAYQTIQVAMQTYQQNPEIQEWGGHALRLMSRLATQRPYARHRWQPRKQDAVFT